MQVTQSVNVALRRFVIVMDSQRIHDNYGFSGNRHKSLFLLAPRPHWTRTPDQVRIQATSFDNRRDCVQDAARLVKTAALRSSSPKPADTIHFG
jgi:hypothetical protein